MQITAPARFLRSSIVAACVMSLAVGAHVIGGGYLPAWPLLLGLASFALVPVTFFAGRSPLLACARKEHPCHHL